jgi:hypothetical protein
MASLDELDPDARGRLLRLVVEKVRVSGWRVEIHLKIPLGHDPDGERQPRPPRPRPQPSSDMRLRSVDEDRRHRRLPARPSDRREGGDDLSSPAGNPGRSARTPVFGRRRVGSIQPAPTRLAEVAKLLGVARHTECRGVVRYRNRCCDASSSTTRRCLVVLPRVSAKTLWQVGGRDSYDWGEIPPRQDVCISAVSCSHEGFHSIHSSYDRRSGLLVYFWICERCGTPLNEARREPYRPRFDPHGNDRFLPAPIR